MRPSDPGASPLLTDFYQLTMLKSYFERGMSGEAVFEFFVRELPRTRNFLVAAAARKVADVAAQLRAEGIAVKGVRIDSGDLGEHARRVRAILDGGDCRGVRIFASGALDEYRLQQLVQAPIDGFGVGTNLVTSADAPHLDCAYKLQEYAGAARRKRSEGKATWPGRKQVHRFLGPGGRMARDVLALESERLEGAPLLRPVMRAGERVGRLPTLEETRSHVRNQMAELPDSVRALERADPPYEVEVSPSLRALTEALNRESSL